MLVKGYRRFSRQRMKKLLRNF